MLIKTEDEMERAISKLTDDQREHLRIVISELIECYLHEEIHGMVLIGNAPYERFKVMAVNTNEMDAALLLGSANEYIQNAIMDDAPPKELFN